MKGDSFSDVLRRLIRDAYGSQRSFAEAIGRNESWVSQLLSGAAEHVTYPTLTSLLKAFPDSVRQEELYEAWRHTFAPSPDELTGVDVSEESINAFLKGLPHTASMGSVVSMYRQARRIWRTVRTTPDRIDLLFSVGRVLCELCYSLGRRSEGVRLAHELESRSREADYASGIAHSLWLQGLARQELLDGSERELVAIYEPLKQYLDWWKPQTETEREQHVQLQQSLIRDKGSLAHNLLQIRRGSIELVQSSIDELDRLTAVVDHGIGVSLAKATQAKLYTILGQDDLAWEALQQAQRVLPEKSPNDQVRFLLQEVSLLISEKDIGEVESKLSLIHDLTEEFGLHHYKARAIQLESRLMQLSDGSR